ncbi:translocase SEC61 complex gamma subunit [Capsaspora owczarzaki ATCC 30864]|uniref:Translocase SEC61 complex gamma subunit n=1 Tax=Capsaspora owczarzaki (strain ATCC 30864) TaxID=595528 RepID=A0A0D2U2F1_CAPO3|nr:translocase SEC61 complex gamma subunit [Capsaspora owczarzaki ATCC 30864]KJE89391.1 translocase SEC61 complex gamma subunit [Capsaspora owczarzaki ATCC 30864]|eukprot:XP_004365740.1 translocase SEC61 complex gamma subunit [Capsaspora owczarzaki ATCC 30864]
MDYVNEQIESVQEFAQNSKRLINKCSKPDRKEFQKIAVATAVGFAVLGFVGFFIKLIHIPINQIIVGG